MGDDERKTERRETLAAESTTCARCGETVGIIWFRGHSTLFSGPIDTDGKGNLVVSRHTCKPGKDNLVIRRNGPPK